MTGSRLPARIAAWGAVALLVHGALSAAEPRLDVHGDPLPAGAIDRLGHACFRAGGEVKSLLFAPDGQALVSGSTDGVIRFWDPKTGKEVLRFTGHRQAV